jgi:hypothetical protein
LLFFFTSSFILFFSFLWYSTARRPVRAGTRTHGHGARGADYRMALFL